MLKIELASSNANYRPGESVQGRINWEMAAAVPREMHCRLRWHTEGKGDADAEIVEEMKWNPTTASGEQKFLFQVPRAPLSLEGETVKDLVEY